MDVGWEWVTHPESGPRDLVATPYRVQTTLILLPKHSTSTSTSLHRVSLNSLLRASPPLAAWSSNLGTRIGGKLCYNCSGSGAVPFLSLRRLLVGFVGVLGDFFRGVGWGGVR